MFKPNRLVIGETRSETSAGNFGGKTQKVLRAAAMIIAGGAVAFSTAAPASAAPSHTTATQASTASGVTRQIVNPYDSNGQCYVDEYSASAWGWCDGTGPQRYAIYAACTNGRVYESSSHPWFGDRRGAWVYCPSGTYLEFAFGDYA